MTAPPRELEDLEAPVAPPAALSPRELARWAWRSLTSMRTALILLFLLAVAAVPGSIVPQRSVDPIKVTDFFRDDPGLARWFDRLHLFSVYSSPWFAAIYLLLFVSLVGCVVPRARLHWRASRATPPPAPRRLERLPAHVRWETAVAPDAVLAAASRELRGWRTAASSDGTSLAAEKGYLRETGNLLFHLSLLVVLVGIAVGSLVGFKGTVLVPVGEGFANTVTQYDDITPGSLYRTDRLPPFRLTLDRFTARWETAGPQRGAPREYRADVTYIPHPGAGSRTASISVNHPLDVGGARVFLVGNGYAPEVTVRDGTGAVVARGPVPFLPQDASMASSGVLKVADARPSSLGLQAVFLPTGVLDPRRGPVSAFPDAGNPELYLTAWRGDLGTDSGLAQSVYRLDTRRMTQVASARLVPGMSWRLPDGLGTVTFEGWRRWATFQVAQDPGKGATLAGAGGALVGLMASLFVRRRRVWVRALPGEGGRTVVEVAGLARGENQDASVQVDALVDRLSRSVPKHPLTAPRATGPAPTSDQE